MEYEAWMLALIDNFIISKGGDPAEAFADAGVDHNSDFETTVFHPYNKVQKILQLVKRLLLKLLLNLLIVSI